MKKEELFEIFGDINSQYIREAHMSKKGKEKSVWTKWMAVAACFVMISVISVPVINHFIPNGSDDVLEDNTPVGDESQNTPTNSNSLKELHTEMIKKLVVNKVDGMMSVSLDAKATYYEKLPQSVWEAVMEEFYDFIGVSYKDFTSGLSVSGEIFNFYSVSTRGYKDGWVEDEYRLHDYVFGYRTESGGEATIALSSVGAPLRDYYFACENPQQSEIGDVSLVIYEYEDMYMVQFSYENVNYDIETNNMTLEELETLLRAIIATSESTSEESPDESQGATQSTDIEDVPADANGDYHDAVDSNDLTKDTSEFFGGSYLDNNGKFNVVLTEDTPENRASICKELGIVESNTVFREGTYTLAYLTELQAKISNAMINKEMPFIISSGVYETVNKIKVRSTSNDEAELAKLYALDTIGGAIEVEYVSENTMSTEILLIDK